MNNKQLMKLIVEKPQLVKKKMLTHAQIKVFNIIKGRGVIGISSYSLAAKLLITVQSASGRLKALYEKDYLIRTEVTAESGGIEYVYKVAI